MTSSKFLSLSSNTTGTTWNTFQSVTPATVLHVLNNTGTTISFRRTGDTSAEFQLPTGIAWSFRGLTDSAQMQMRRTDLSNSSVTVYSEVEFENFS
jgi:hypothetical protein